MHGRWICFSGLVCEPDPVIATNWGTFESDTVAGRGVFCVPGIKHSAYKKLEKWGFYVFYVAVFFCCLS